MAASKFKMPKVPPMPPEVQKYLHEALFQIGRTGAKAAAAAMGSAVGDARKTVKKVEKRLREIQENAERLSSKEEEDD